MIVGCFRGCFSFNAETIFEKARLQATYTGDYEPPAESDIQQILLTLAGNDPETRPDVAFQLIQSKMQYSESKNQWNYLVKNLILLDRTVEDRSFVSDIATIHILHVENYKDPDPKNNIIKIDGFIRKYFQYIKMKSRLYAKKNSSFNVSKNEKRKYFQSLTNDKIFFEMSEAVTLFNFIIELVKTNTDPLKRVSKRGYLEYKLNQYVFHLMLYTMMNLYTTMFTIIAILLERLTETQLSEATKIKQFYLQFLKNNELFSQFVEDHKFIKGYEEIKLSDFYQPNRNTMNVINDWITLLESRNNMVNPDAVIIKLDKDFQLQKIVITTPNQSNVVKYPIKTDNKYNFLGDDENCVYIKQVNSELKDGINNNLNESSDSLSFRLDKQDSNICTSVYQNYLQTNNEELEKYSLFNSQRFSDDLQKGFQFGKHAKNNIKILETAEKGFSVEFFSIFKNEYSAQFSKGSKYIKQQIYNNKFEKCNALEVYFEQSFQNTVSFMINDRMSILDTIKELPTFHQHVFEEFKNEYSVAQPMHYTFDDSKIKYQPESIKNIEAKNINVQDVYQVQGIDSNQASEFITNLMLKDEKNSSQNVTPSKGLNNNTSFGNNNNAGSASNAGVNNNINQSPALVLSDKNRNNININNDYQQYQNNESPQKINEFQQKLNEISVIEKNEASSPMLSPYKQEEKQEIAFIPSPVFNNNDNDNNDNQRNIKEQNDDEYEIFNKGQQSSSDENYNTVNVQDLLNKYNNNQEDQQQHNFLFESQNMKQSSQEQNSNNDNNNNYYYQNEQQPEQQQQNENNNKYDLNEELLSSEHIDSNNNEQYNDSNQYYNGSEQINNYNQQHTYDKTTRYSDDHKHQILDS